MRWTLYRKDLGGLTESASQRTFQRSEGRKVRKSAAKLARGRAHAQCAHAARQRRSVAQARLLNHRYRIHTHGEGGIERARGDHLGVIFITVPAVEFVQY